MITSNYYLPEISKYNEGRADRVVANRSCWILKLLSSSGQELPGAGRFRRLGRPDRLRPHPDLSSDVVEAKFR